MMLEKGIVNHCAPTLASLKTGSLFHLPHDPEESVAEQIDAWNAQLLHKGVRVVLMRQSQKGSLIYVFRPRQLERDLSRPCVQDFLARYGYEKTDVESALRRLRQRLAMGEEFPHEIGLFLSYPLEDVEGFIENGGKNSKCTGCWKVYCNEKEAMRRFSQFDKCAKVYRQLWAQGRPLEKLTVAV